MEKEGLKSLFPMHELSIIGFVDVIKNLFSLLGRIRQTVKFLKAEKPDVLVTIDAPDFSLRVAKKLKGHGIKLIHYTPPTVWLGARDAKEIAEFLDHLLAIYPFEPKYFEKEGLPCTFIGHAITEKGINLIEPQEFRETFEIAQETPLLCVLPGSRKSEINALLPIFKVALERLKRDIPNLEIALPVAPTVYDLVKETVKEWPFPVRLVENEALKYQLMRASNMALAASGTVNLELAMANTPFVIVYKGNPLSAWIAKKLLTINYVAMVNIIEDEEIVPELLQEKCTPENIYYILRDLWDHPEKRKEMQERLEQVVIKLLPQEAKRPSQKAAEVILKVCDLD